MTSERWRAAAALFGRALELPEHERDAFLESECAGDHALLARVRAMLRADRTSTPVLDATPDVLAFAVDVAVPLTLEGRRIGPYTVEEVIGRGGMGVVCRAVREDVGLRVALKLVAAGLASPEHIARFHQERRLLARLEHPNIARLLDAGVAEDGTPWLAMEYAPGDPIDVYCDAHRLPVKRRLELFEKVGDAVAYAHRHLIVHRDLKPANILVSPDGEPRLLDFGIAKLLDDPQLEQQPLTRTGFRLMTPQYASPEQLRNDPVSTASDVYQLGGLLFELLTGRPPHPGRVELRLVAQGSVITKPSRSIDRSKTAAVTPGPTSPTAEIVAAARSTTPDRLRRRLAGDLDNIVLKATEQDPARRYATARELADDVRRHREGLPVAARAPTLPYRLRKFIGRHRAGTAVAAAALVALVGFGFALRRQAEQVLAERERAEQVSDLMADLFAGADPEVAQGDTLTVVSLLDRGTARIRADSTLDPRVGARLLFIIATAHQNLGREEAATAIREEGVAALRRVVPPTDPTLLHGIATLGSRLLRVDRPRGAAMLEEADSVARTLGRDRRVELANVLHEYGYALQSIGDREAARARYVEALAIYRAIGSPGEIERTLHDLGYLAHDRGDVDAARAYWEEALERRRERLGAEHSLTASVMLSLSQLLVDEGRLDEAEQLVRDAVAVQQRVFEQPTSQLASGLGALARVLSAKGDHAQAEPYAREAVAMMARVWGDSTRPVALGTANLAIIVQDQGRVDEAAALHRDALALYNRLDDDASTAVTMRNLAHNAFLRQNLAESDSLYRRAIPVLDSVWDGTTRIKNALYDHAWVLYQTGRCDEAEPLLRRAIRMDSLDFAASGRRDARPVRTLGACLASGGRLEQAEPILLEAHRILVDNWGADNPFTRSSAENLARLYELMGRPAEAARYRGGG